MQKRVETDIIIIIGVLGIVIFSLLGVYSFVIGDIEFIFDGFFSAAVIGFALYLYKRINIKPLVLLFGLLLLITHNLRLYGYFYFGIAFDHWIHALSGIFLGFVFYRYFSKTIKHKSEIIILSILVSAGFGALLEIIEFVGYLFVGATGSQGLLFYGPQDFAEYTNIGWDLISNTIGALAGNLILLIKSWIWKK